MKYQHIELFAGCGGMSLGLDAAGFNLYMANELSPMAGETFAYNILNENLNSLAKDNVKSESVLWVKSQYNRDDLKSRLRENPFDFSKGKVFDIDSKTNLKNKLIIGNINDLLSSKYQALFDKIKEQNIDLLSGGPPCQSFSLAGRREKDNVKNLLPLSFARFAEKIQPKFVLLENVKGITSPFTLDNHKYYAWIEVAKAFSLSGFVPICFMLNSKYFGIPQNRPRFILLGVRHDISKLILNVKLKEPKIKLLKKSIAFFDLVNSTPKHKLENISSEDLTLYDIDKSPELFDGELMPKIVTNKQEFISAKEAIDDLILNSQSSISEYTKSKYLTKLEKLFQAKNGILNKELNNHHSRSHSYEVKARFRWLQIISNLNGLAPQALKILAGQINDENKAIIVFAKIRNEKLLLKDEKGERLMKIKDYNSFLEYIDSIQTKKHSQRAIKKEEPAPAQMTIPDDLCHYSPKELRTLTVREMARLQSFPDWFTFRSKVTTGGDQRRFEVPQYTQVGNAVPPLLAFEIGLSISNILDRISSKHTP